MSNDPALTGCPAGDLAHPSSVLEWDSVGSGSCLGEFCRVIVGSTVGRDVKVGADVQIAAGVAIGNRVVIDRGNRLPDGLGVCDDVSIGPSVVFMPSAAEPGPEGKAWIVQSGASIGGHATVLAGCSVGTRAVVEPGAFVDRDVPPNAIVRGNPARVVGYVDTPVVRPTPTGSLPTLRVPGTAWHRLPRIVDTRGALTFGEAGRHLPFAPLRFFAICDVGEHEVRGEHAHRELHQFLVCLKGSVSVVLDDGRLHEEVALDTPEIGLHIRPMVWGIQYRWSRDALLLVLASDVYIESDYIRSYEEFIQIVGCSAPTRQVEPIQSPTL